ncbi:MAG: hypothetical protein R3F02_18485 [Thiolinea sp.]
MNAQPINMTVEVRHQRTRQLIQLTDQLWANDSDNDRQLIDQLISRQQHSIPRGGYDLIDYRIEPAQMEMFQQGRAHQ